MCFVRPTPTPQPQSHQPAAQPEHHEPLQQQFNIYSSQAGLSGTTLVDSPSPTPAGKPAETPAPPPPPPGPPAGPTSAGNLKLVPLTAAGMNKPPPGLDLQPTVSPVPVPTDRTSNDGYFLKYYWSLIRAAALAQAEPMLKDIQTLSANNPNIAKLGAVPEIEKLINGLKVWPICKTVVGETGQFEHPDGPEGQTLPNTEIIHISRGITMCSMLQSTLSNTNNWGSMTFWGNNALVSVNNAKAGLEALYNNHPLGKKPFPPQVAGSDGKVWDTQV